MKTSPSLAPRSRNSTLCRKVMQSNKSGKADTNITLASSQEQEQLLLA